MDLAQELGCGWWREGGGGLGHRQSKIQTCLQRLTEAMAISNPRHNTCLTDATGDVHNKNQTSASGLTGAVAISNLRQQIRLRTPGASSKTRHPRSASELTEPRASSKTRIKSRHHRLRRPKRFSKQEFKLGMCDYRAKAEFLNKNIF